MLLPTGKRVDTGADSGCQQRERFAGRSQCLVLLGTAGAGVGREAQAVAHGQLSEQAGLGADECDSERRPFVCGHLGDVTIREPDLAGVGVDQAG